MPQIQVQDVRLSYSISGRGPAVLMVQGAGVVGGGWRPQIDALAGRFTCIAFDHRGIGGSTLGTAPLTIEAMAADALAIADAEGLERFHLVAHSMGGLIAQHLALSAPGRVLSLSLLCTFARGPQGARLSLPLAVTGLRMHVGTARMRRHAFLGLVMPASYLANVDRESLAERLAQLYGYDLARQPSIALRQVRAMGRFDAFNRVANLAPIPALVVSAAHDRIALPKYGRTLAGAIPGARYVEVPDAAHAVTIQRADTVNALLADHLERAGT